VRVTLDTNQWVSGITRPQTSSGMVLEHIRQGWLEAVASRPLAVEMLRVLRRPRIRQHFGITDADVRRALGLIRRPLVRRLDIVAPIADPKDRPVLASAVAGRANVIVSGDRHLHDPQVTFWLARQGIRVLYPRQLVNELEERTTGIEMER
jgi:putative PIN family toxin of toxin-antitoxin system